MQQIPVHALPSLREPPSAPVGSGMASLAKAPVPSSGQVGRPALRINQITPETHA